MNLKFRIKDHKLGKEVPVHRMECNSFTGEVIAAWGYDYNDPDSDFSGYVTIGGHLEKKTGKPGEKPYLRYELIVENNV